VEKYDVIAVSLDTQSEMSLTIEADEAEASEDIVLSTYFDGVKIIARNNYGYFATFQEIRDELLQKGYGIRCMGAMLNAVQSGMASVTHKVYIVTLGKQAKMSDLVCLYDYANINEFPNTKKQNDFQEKWIKSLGNE
jgi:hypothetical protein